jgi:hypothetical protein
MKRSAKKETVRSSPLVLHGIVQDVEVAVDDGEALAELRLRDDQRRVGVEAVACGERGAADSRCCPRYAQSIPMRHIQWLCLEHPLFWPLLGILVGIKKGSNDGEGKQSSLKGAYKYSIQHKQATKFKFKTLNFVHQMNF